MIKYRLRCARGHEFETWFQNSAAFEKLAKRLELTCATCGSDKVEKAIMAPRVARTDKGPGAVAPAVDASLPAASDDTRDGRALRAAMAALRKTVIDNADYVGPRFAEEARRIHEDDAPVRGIYGEASMEEARDLIEDGISILPLPPAAGDKN